MRACERLQIELARSVNSPLTFLLSLNYLSSILTRSQEIDLEIPLQCTSAFQRRSAFNIQQRLFLSPIVEDLKNIQTLQVTFVMQPLGIAKTYQYLNRVSAWLVQNSLQNSSNDKILSSNERNERDQLNIEIIVEADVIEVDCSGASTSKNVYVDVGPTCKPMSASQYSPIQQVASSVKTVFGVVKLNGNNFEGSHSYRLDLNKAQCSVCFDDSKHERISSVVLGSKVVCRIPYVKDRWVTEIL